MSRKTLLLAVALAVGPLCARSVPASVTRLSHTDGGSVSLIDSVVVHDDVVVTAVSAGGDLRLISWKVSADGKITRLSHTDGGSVSLIDAVVVHDDIVVTAVSSGGYLRMISWKVSADGKITRLSHTDGGDCNRVKAIVMPNNVVIAAVRSAKRLGVFSYRVSEDGKIIKADFALAGTINDIEAVARRGANEVITSVAVGRSPKAIFDYGEDPFVRAIKWNVSPDGKLKRVSHMDTGHKEIGEFLTRTDDGYEYQKEVVLSAGLDKTLTLPNGNVVMPVHGPPPLPGSDLSWGVNQDSVPSPREVVLLSDELAVVVYAGTRRLHVSVWKTWTVPTPQDVTSERKKELTRRLYEQTYPPGMGISRVDLAIAGTVSHFDAVVVHDDIVVTPVRTGGELRMISWKITNK